MAGHQRSFFPVPGGPPVNQSFMTLPPQFAVNQSMQQSFIAQNNMLAAQAAVATANVPTSIFRLGVKGLPPTPVLNSGISRFQDQTNTPNDDDCEWLEYFDEGKAYYHNRVTKVTTWTKPDAPFKAGVQTITQKTTTTSSPSSKSAWKEYKSKEGRSYYHNHETKETTWTKPEDFNESPPAEKRAKLSPIIDPIPRLNVEFLPAIQPNQTPPTVDLTNEVPLDFSKLEIPMPDESKSDMEKAMEATLKNLPPPEPKPVETTIDPIEFKQQQIESYKQLLVEKHKDGKLKSVMTWEQALRQIQNDTRFKMITKISEKKRLFNEWKIQQQKDERDARKLALRKAKEDYEKFILNDPRVLPTMAYSKVDRLFGNEDFCKSLGDADKREIFNATIGKVRRKREENIKELKQKCREVLVDLLDSLPEITYKTLWSDAQRIISSCNAFNDHHELKRMHKLEILESFGDYIRKAEKHHMDEKEQHHKMTRREERKVRDAFRDLISELHQKGTITINSKWTQIYPIIRQDSRFTSMLSQPGSTPLDIFKFFVEDLKTSYNSDRKKIRDIMHKLDLRVTIDMPFEDFETKIREVDKEHRINSVNLNIYFLAQLDKCSKSDGKSETDHDEEEKADENSTIDKDKKPKKAKKSKKEGKKSKKEKKRKREKEERNDNNSDKEEGEV